ncbi:hypothetical protein RCL1_007342 [Eukaryota sp. TZLM3-RCL]
MPNLYIPPSVFNRSEILNPNLSLLRDFNGWYYLEKTPYCLSTEEISLLSSLQHPALLGYHQFNGQEPNDLLYNYCKFGPFYDLDLSKHALSSHDLWSIRNQLFQGLSYLASQGLYHKGLNVSNVLVCSLDPLRIKLSLFSNSRVLIDSVASNVPLQEFWKQKMNEQEEVCFDDLIRSIVKSVFPYSILEKNIVFTNPNTHDRNDLESLKALICSIESEPMFKSDQYIGDFSNVNNALSQFLPSNPEKRLSLTYVLLIHVLAQRISNFETPLLEFNVRNHTFKCENRDFLYFAERTMSISSYFRHVFFKAFDLACIVRGHHLALVDFSSLPTKCILSTCCENIYHFSNRSIILVNFLKRNPFTAIKTARLKYNIPFLNIEKVTEIELDKFNEDLSVITKFPAVSTLSFSNTVIVLDFNVLSSCDKLSSISFSAGKVHNLASLRCLPQLNCLSLDGVDITNYHALSELKGLVKLSVNGCEFDDLNPLSWLLRLRYLSLTRTKVYDLWPLRNLTKLSTLVLRETVVPEEHQREITNPFEIRELINSYKLGADLVLINTWVTLDLFLFSHLLRIKLVDLSGRSVNNISVISIFTGLLSLNLSNVELDGIKNNRISDISFLSYCVKLKALSLEGSRVSDLSPLSRLFDLESLSLRNSEVFDLFPLKPLTKLSYLDVTNTCIPMIHQSKHTTSSGIQSLVDLFEHGVFGLDFSTKCLCVNLSLYSHFVGLKSLVLAGNYVSNFSVFSQFAYLETVDLSNVRCNNIVDFFVFPFCINLKSLSLNSCEVHDVSPLSYLTALESLFLNDNYVFDLWPLNNLTKLSTLDLRKTLLPREHQQEITNSSEIKTLINSFEHGVALDFSNHYNTIDISVYSHCSRLKSLNLVNKTVRNLSEISKLTNLETLELSNVKLPAPYGCCEQITDISFLSSCIKLRSLSLDGSKVTDLGPLSSLSDLSHVSLNRTEVSDITPLVSSSHVKSLSLNKSLFSHLSQLSNFKQLESLSLNYNNITDISPLSSLKNLKVLSLCNNKISDLSPLSGLQFLEELHLNNNEITDINPLSLLLKLEELSLQGNHVDDVSVPENLTKTSTLDLR